MFSHYPDFIWYRALAQLRSESSRAYLGYLWWVLEPMLYLLVFYVVFALVLNRGDEDYVQVLLAGLIVWRWIEGSVRSSMDVIQHNAGLINKVHIPKIVFPAISIVSSGVKFALVFALFLMYSIVFGQGISVTWLMLPVLIAVHFLLVSAASCFVAAVIPFVPDVRMIFDKLMTLMFFLSGIFYTAASIPEEIRPYFRLNPAFLLIENYREILVYHRWPSAASLITVLLLSLVLFVIAYFILRRFDRVYPRLIY